MSVLSATNITNAVLSATNFAGAFKTAAKTDKAEEAVSEQGKGLPEQVTSAKEEDAPEASPGDLVRQLGAALLEACVAGDTHSVAKALVQAEAERCTEALVGGTFPLPSAEELPLYASVDSFALQDEKGKALRVGEADCLDFTPLQVACMFGQPVVVQLLVRAAENSGGFSRPFDLNHPGASGVPPIHYAAAGLHLRTVQLLMELGARPADLNPRGQTALHVLLAQPQLPPEGDEALGRAVDQMLALGVHADARDGSGSTPLGVLAGVERGDRANSGVGLAQLLLDHGADVDAQNARGDSPASMTVDSGNLALFMFLVERRASLFLEDRDKVDVLRLASSSVDFAAALLRRPTLLGSLPVILALGQQFHRNESTFPAYSQQFRALKETSRELALALLESCDDVEAHRLILGHPPAEHERWAAGHALSTALAVRSKRWLAQHHVQDEVRHLWRGDRWSERQLGWVQPEKMALADVVEKGSPKFMFLSTLVSYLTYLVLYVCLIYLDPVSVKDSFHPLEFPLYIYVLGFLVKEASAAWRLRLAYYDDRWNIVDSSICGLHGIVFLCRCTVTLVKVPEPGKMQEVMTVCTSLNLMLSISRLLHTFNVNQTLGPLQLMLSAMMKDIVVFGLIFMILVGSFGLGLYSVYSGANGYSGPFATLSGSFQYLFWAIMGNFDVQDLATESHVNQLYAEVVFAVYMVLGVIVVVNLLIALMSSTYSSIESNIEAEWKTAWALMVYSHLQERYNYLEKPPPFNLLLAPYLLYLKLVPHTHNKVASTAPAPGGDERGAEDTAGAGGQRRPSIDLTELEPAGLAGGGPAGVGPAGRAAAAEARAVSIERAATVFRDLASEYEQGLQHLPKSQTEVGVEALAVKLERVEGALHPLLLKLDRLEAALQDLAAPRPAQGEGAFPPPHPRSATPSQPERGGDGPGATLSRADTMLAGLEAIEDPAPPHLVAPPTPGAPGRSTSFASGPAGAARPPAAKPPTKGKAAAAPSQHQRATAASTNKRRAKIKKTMESSTGKSGAPYKAGRKSVRLV